MRVDASSFIRESLPETGSKLQATYPCQLRPRSRFVSQDLSVMNEAHPSEDDPGDVGEAAARGAEEAGRRSEAAAIRRGELAQALAGQEYGTHEAVERASRAANEALVRSAEAHESSAEAHERAAQLYERAAQLAERQGAGDKASRYRESAVKAHEEARLAVRSAQADRDRVAQKTGVIDNLGWRSGND